MERKKKTTEGDKIQQEEKPDNPLPDVAEILKAAEGLGGGGQSGQGEQDDDFEELFAKFASFKDRASGLGESERKAYAEKVATSFWMALGGGGGEDEDGLEDSDLE